MQAVGPRASEPLSALAEPSFDRYARMVRRALDVPVALVSIVETNRQVFPGAAGLPEPFETCRETPLSHSFCQYVVQDAKPLVISDARDDERLRDNLAIEDLNVIAYAGWPLVDRAGVVIGSLCAIDSRPREWTSTQLDALEDLAEACSSELSQREARREADDARSAARAVSRRARVLLQLSEALAATNTLDEIVEVMQRLAIDNLGCDYAGLWVREGASRLCYVAHPDRPWPHAERDRELPFDDSTPMGGTLLAGYPQFWADQDELAARYPDFAAQAATAGAWAVLPLSAGTTALGVLGLLWPRHRDFTDDDRLAVAALTAYTAQAVQRAQLLAERASATTTLMRAMLTDLPRISTLQLAARYRAAIAQDEVGGDWYDAVVLPSGDTALTIGDVSGHDIQAAGFMGQLRSMLRAFAWAVDDSPAANVARLDRAMRHMRIRSSATLVFGRIEQSEAEAGSGVHTFRWTNAGHPPPVLVAPDGTTRFLSDGAPADPLVGVVPNHCRRDQAATIPPGATLLLYTDGLIERQGEAIDVGLDRLAAVVARHHDRSIDAMVDAVIDDLVGYHPDDDVAVMAVRFPAEQPA